MFLTATRSATPPILNGEFGFTAEALARIFNVDNPEPDLFSLYLKTQFEDRWDLLTTSEQFTVLARLAELDEARRAAEAARAKSLNTTAENRPLEGEV